MIMPVIGKKLNYEN